MENYVRPQCQPPGAVAGILLNSRVIRRAMMMETTGAARGGGAVECCPGNASIAPLKPQGKPL